MKRLTAASLHCARLSLCTAGSFCCILAASPLVQDPSLGPAAEIYALLDEFDPFDATELQPVKVSIPRGAQGTMTRYGFLLRSEGRRFTVRHLDVGTCTYVFSPAESQEQRIRFESVDLRGWADETANDARRETARNQSPSGRSPDAPISSWTHALLLARACARRGLAAEARLLWGALPAHEQTRHAIQKSVWFSEDMRERLILDCADPALSWSDLVARHDRFLDLLPGFPNADQVRSQRDLIRKVLAHERAAGTQEGPAAEVQDLVSRLCDQFVPSTFHFDSSPLAPRAPADSYGPQPVERLLALGLRAVPALIDALDDRTPTRSVWYCGRFGGSFGLDTVGETAEWTLQRIAGVSRGRDKAAWRAWYDRASLVGLDAAFEEAHGSGPAPGAPRPQRGALSSLIDAVATQSGWRR